MLTKLCGQIRRNESMEITLFFIIILIMILTFKAYALDVGDVVPGFHIVTIDGKEISYEKDIKGKKPLYLAFWSTW